MLFLIFFVFLFYRAYLRSDLMLCLFAVDAFVCNVYFVFTTSIRLVSFSTMITFYEVSAHFFNVLIFVTIKALNYFTVSCKYNCVFSDFFSRNFSMMILLTFFENLVLTMNKKTTFFNRFTYRSYTSLMMFKFL